MKHNRDLYTEIVSEELSELYDERKHGSPENFVKLISESVDRTIAFYEENYDFDDDDFDMEVFQSDLVSDAKKSL